MSEMPSLNEVEQVAAGHSLEPADDRMRALAQKLRIADGKGCPFDDEGFHLETPQTPCPKCGMLGTTDAEDKCVGLLQHLHRESAGAIDTLSSRVAKLQDENAKLHRLLYERDRFIVRQDLWGTFVRALSASSDVKDHG